MKLTKNIAVGAAAVLLLVILSAPGLQAQSTTLKVSIPWAFHVGDKTLPAGTYLVQTAGAAIRISDQRGNSAVVLSNAVAKPFKRDRDELIFTQYGTNFFLSEARWTGYTNARGVVKSNAESLLANSLSPARVHLAALVR